jgi:anti-sigma factor RsiW
MECALARERIERRIDGELTSAENAELDVHLSECPACLRELGILSLPGRIARVSPPPAASPFFLQKVRLRIEEEARTAASWQFIFGTARKLVPALAGVTLALLSVFAYLQMSVTESEFYRLYERAFVSHYQPHRALLFEQERITHETVLSAIAEREAAVVR